MGFNVFLLGQVSPLAYERFGLWTAACVAIYFLYCGAASYNKAARAAGELPTQIAAVELPDQAPADAK